MVKSSNLGTKSLKVRAVMKRQIAKLASGLLYCWCLWRNNTAINLQMFSSSYGSRTFAACDQGSHWGFFPPKSVFSSTCVSRFNYEKSREICVFWSDKLISIFNLFSNIKTTLHYSVYMRTSGEKVRISDYAESVQSVSYSHTRSLSGLDTLVFLIEGKRGTCLRLFFFNCNV